MPSHCARPLLIVLALALIFSLLTTKAYPEQYSPYSPFPDIGQTKCLENTSEITCPSPGQPFYDQDAQYDPRILRKNTGWVTSQSTWKTEIGILNPTPSTTTGILKGYNSQGVEIWSQNIILPGNGRRELDVSTTAGSVASQIKSMRLDISSGQAVGYQKSYQTGKYRFGLEAQPRPNQTSLYVPHIASNNDWRTDISLTNTTSRAKNLRFSFDNGASATKSLASKGHEAFSIASLFGGTPQLDIETAQTFNGNGMVGLMLFGGMNSNILSGVSLSDVATSTLHFPHIAHNSEWWTGLVVYNPNNQTANLILRYYDSLGVQIGTGTVQVVGSGQKLVGTPTSLNFPTGTEWLTVQASQPVTGFELFGSMNQQQLAGYSVASLAASSGILPKLERDGWTGVAFVNPGSSTIQIQLMARNDAGDIIAQTALNMAPGQKLALVAENFFENKDISSATYLSFTATGDVAGFQLNGSADGTMLDAVPALGGSHTGTQQLYFPHIAAREVSDETLENVARVLWQRDTNSANFPAHVREKLDSWKNNEQELGKRMAARIVDMKANPDSFTPSYQDMYDTFLGYTESLSPHRAYSMGYALGMEISRGYEEVPAKKSFVFPEDDAPAWRFQNGWHFFVGTVLGDNGVEYGVQFMLWHNALLPPALAEAKGLSDLENQIVEMHLAVTPANGRHYRSKPYVVAGTTGLVGFSASPFTYYQGNNKIESLRKDKLFPLQIQAWGLDSTQEDPVEIQIQLTLDQAKPYMLNGVDGMDPSCGGVGTLYYSVPNCPVRPTESYLVLDGQKVTLTGGKLWYDHQWGSSPGAVNPRRDVLRALNNLEEQGPDGWEWIAVMFDDDTEMALSSLKDLSNKDFYYQTGPEPPGEMIESARGRYMDGAGAYGPVTASLRITDWVKSTVSHDEYMATNTWYPNRVEVTVESGDVPEEKKHFTLIPIVQTGQTGWFATGWQYSEGAVFVQAQNGELLGRGFLESTDWADWRAQVLRIMGLPQSDEMMELISKRKPSEELIKASAEYLAQPEKQHELWEILSGCKGL